MPARTNFNSLVEFLIISSVLFDTTTISFLSLGPTQSWTLM